jgi:ABC-type transport system involved in multi-copper enzyme maturation permease subunit
MNLIPLVEHELRAAVRRPRTFRMRLAAGGVAIGICCWGLLVWADWKSAASLGHSLLEILGWTGFIAAALSGLFLTSDCISQERREGTLGLLFLTDLRGRDVAFGKLVASGLTPVYCLLAMFPPLTVCVIVGGVTAGEVWRLWMVLLNTLFFSLSVAMLTSTICRQQRAAQAVALLAIFLSVFRLPLLGAGLAASSSHSLVCSFVFFLSPACNYLLAYDAPYRSAPGSFWGSLLMTDLLAWGCLLAAGRLLPRMSSEEASLFIRRPGGRWPRLQSRGAAKRQRLRQELLSRNPIAWLASRDGWKQHLTWCLPALALWIWLRFEPASVGGTSVQISFAAFAAIHVFFKVWVGADASHAFASDRLSGTLELLLSTPLQTREVAAGMLSAFERRFAGPLAALLFLDAALAVKLLSVGDPSAAFAVGAGAVMLLADSYCLCWVGLWRGLAARDSARAILATLWRVLVLPWIFFGAGVGIFRQSTLAEFAGMWLFLGLLTDVVLWVNARDFFHGHFRTMALRPFGEKPPRVESKWSPMNWEEEPDNQTTGA